MRVAYFGTWERGYPRNDQVIAALESVGVGVDLVHEEMWAGTHKFGLTPAVLPRLTRAELRLARAPVADDAQAVIVGYPGHFDLWSAKRQGKPVVFNAMVSLYDTFVEDRERFRDGSLPATALRRIDRMAFRAADLVVADTRANADFMCELAQIDEVAVCYIGAEERLFRNAWRRPDHFYVLFVGKFAPLHGLDVIIEAARQLPAVRFRIVGTGQMTQLLDGMPANLEHVPWIDYENLPEEYARAGCALGIFGSSGKAQRVIPHKSFQALAVGTPLIAADTPAAREVLVDRRDCLLVERTADALAEAIVTLRDDVDLAQRLGAGGRATFEREASDAVLGVRWREAIERAIERGGSPVAS
ncbi:MAG TPA: glycosyltransferase [Polyangiaceae bacterium]|nr:glycosyltransferase [Polyangiaceae bacterium]